jgi:hypothetical protein
MSWVSFAVGDGHVRSRTASRLQNKNDLPRRRGEEPQGSRLVSLANGYNYPCRAGGGILKAALPRLSVRIMSFANSIQAKGFGLALWRAM